MERTLRLLGAAALLAGLAACSRGGGAQRAAATGGTVAPTPSATEPATTVEPSTTTSTTHRTTTTAKPLPPGLDRGSSGPEVSDLEQHLAALHYDVGKVDGVFDSVTTQAVIAFQKVEGLARTGRATKEVTDALATAKAPAALLPEGGPSRVEIDLKRQVLFLYEGGQLYRTLMISSGGGYRYCVDGACDRAITPGGSFKVGVKILGAHKSPLGVLYNPLFFNGGIAIHGEPAVPTYPASHGCVRIPMSASKWFYDEVPSGTPVYVFGGPKAPVPFNTPAPDGTPPAAPQTPPTTATPPPTVATSTTARPVLPPLLGTTTTTP
jgi:hypothetical protein